MHPNVHNIMEYFNIMNAEAIEQKILVFKEILKSQIIAELTLQHFDR